MTRAEELLTQCRRYLASDRRVEADALSDGGSRKALVVLIDYALRDQGICPICDGENGCDTRLHEQPA